MLIGHLRTNIGGIRINIQENGFENVVCKTSANLLRPLCVYQRNLCSFQVEVHIISPRGQMEKNISVSDPVMIVGMNEGK